MRSKKQAAKISKVEKLLELLSQGDLSGILKVRIQENETETAKIIREIAKNLSNYMDALDGICHGDFRRKIPIFSNRDQIAIAVSNVIESVEHTAKMASDVKVALETEKNKLVQEDWVKSQYTNIFSKIQGVKTITELGNIVLSEVSFSVDAQMGAFFVRDDEKLKESTLDSFSSKLRLVATYGTSTEFRKKEFFLSEGIIGQCATDLRPRYMEKIPKDFIRIESGLGSIQPASVVIIPITYETDLYGVLELASMGTFSDIQKRLLNQISNSIGISIRSISGNMLTEKLLEEIAKTNNSLASQKQALDYSAIVAETDTAGRITYVNEKFLQISKYSRQDLLGQDHRILNSGHHQKDFFISLWKTIAKGDVWHGEVKNRAKDGTYYWVDTTIYPVKDERGKLQKYVAIRFDITDKKRAFEELQVATEQAKKAAKAKTEFLANMSHEIRTPMNAIIGMGELLRETPLNIDQERCVNILNNSGSTLLDVINNILDLSKIESGHFDLEQIPYDLEDLVYSTVEIMGRSAHKKGLELIVSIDPDVNVNLIGDPSRIRQVVINLLGNAIKFTKVGEIVLRIENSTKHEREVTFCVSDTGVGINQEKIGKLFQSFSQANTSITREYGGTGLGLAISKRIIEMMGGSIWAESAEWKGSQFYFSIPVVSQIIPTKKPLDLKQYEGMKALIADDNRTSRAALKNLLLQWKMVVDESENGSGALDMLRAASQSGSPYQVVILDLHMTGMSGLDVISRIPRKLLENTVSIVMLTSEDKRGDLGRPKSKGISAYLVKPIRPSDLHQIIFNTINQTGPTQTVLVVDDEIEIREQLAAIIRSLKVNVLTAGNGKEGLNLLRKNEIHSVLTDLKMPEMDGLSLLKETRKLGQDVPFIFISGYSSQLNSNVLSGFGMVDILDKPHESSDLLDLVDRHLERSNGGEQRKVVHLAPSVNTKPLRLLVVDDVKENIELIRVYLKKFPYAVEVASSGQEAIERFLKAKYNLILMDIQMPIMDGHEATRQIREIESKKGLSRTAIVSLSAHALSEEMQNSLNAGADAYLTKPIKKASLLEAIEKYANLWSQADREKDRIA